MEDKIKQLEPRNFWEQFVEISRIPRRSKEEARVREYVISEAKRMNLENITDSAGNLLVRKEGRGIKKNAPITILQSHLDMVCVAEEGKEHDFGKDPIELLFDGTYVKAKNTSLGADNGIGVAAMLALMEDPSLKSGPLEFLFTVDEETGLTGALGMDTGLLKGRRLLNLDTGEEGVLYIGCAGGLNVTSTLQFTGRTSFKERASCYSLRVTGLVGGHSGIDINKGRANAIKVLSGLLQEIRKSFEFSLVSIKGGNASNVIPREAEAVILAKDENSGDMVEAVEAWCALKRREFGPEEPDLKVEIQEIREHSFWEAGMDQKSSDGLIDILCEFPHGPLAMSDSFPDLVEISNNLATVKTEENKITIGMNCRSPLSSSMDSVASSIEKIGKRMGMKTEYGSRYPGWKPDFGSPLLMKAASVYREIFGKEPEIKATHAGLECGVIGSKYPGMDIVSLGAVVEDLHSPGERVHVLSVERFWKFLRCLI